MLEAQYTEHLEHFVMTAEARTFSYLNRTLSSMTDAAIGKISHGVVIEMREFLSAIEAPKEYILVDNFAPKVDGVIVPKRNLYFRVAFSPVRAILLLAIIEEISRLLGESLAVWMMRYAIKNALQKVLTPLRFSRLIHVIEDPKRHFRAYLPQFTCLVEADFARVHKRRDTMLTRAAYRVLIPKREYDVFFAEALSSSMKTGVSIEQVDLERAIIEEAKTLGEENFKE